MSPPAPKPLSVSTSPSVGPAAARVAAQDAQIAQLVQQNRSLEHSVAELRAQLRVEEARGVDAVKQIRERWMAESREWRHGCDSLQARHRLAHLGTRVALEHERGLRLEDKEALIREKTATLLREYKITLFQARETELMTQVAALEDEIRSQREEMVDILSQHDTELARVNVKLAKADARQQENVEQAGNFTQERMALETELAALRTSATSGTKQIERLTLQMETLRTQNETLETHNRELRHQVEKWQSLEDKGEKEVEALRKRRVELEVRVKELELNLKESRGVDKKIAKLEASLLETQEQVEEAHQNIVEAQADAMQAQKRASKLEGQVAKLKAALDIEKARSAEVQKEKAKPRHPAKPSNKVQPRVSPIMEREEVSEEELSPKPPVRQKPSSLRPDKPSSQDKGNGKATAADGPETTHARHKGMSEEHVVKVNGAADALEDGEVVEIERGADAEAEDEEGVSQPTKKRGRRQDRGSDMEDMPRPGKESRSASSSRPGGPKDAAKRLRPRTGKGKAKESEDEDEDERPKRRARSKPPSTIGGGKRSDEDTDEEQPTRKKKRKLNVTGNTSIFGGPAGFTWDQGGEGDLGIPSVLSPLKEGQPVPARSTSAASSILSAWKMW